MSVRKFLNKHWKPASSIISWNKSMRWNTGGCLQWLMRFVDIIVNKWKSAANSVMWDKKNCWPLHLTNVLFESDKKKAVCTFKKYRGKIVLTNTILPITFLKTAIWGKFRYQFIHVPICDSLLIKNLGQKLSFLLLFFIKHYELSECMQTFWFWFWGKVSDILQQFQRITQICTYYAGMKTSWEKWARSQIGIFHIMGYIYNN